MPLLFCLIDCFSDIMAHIFIGKVNPLGCLVGFLSRLLQIGSGRRFITSPFVNDEVNALAEEALNKSSIGMDDITDLLALTYYAGNYAHKSVQECAMEMQDT